MHDLYAVFCRILLDQGKNCTFAHFRVNSKNIAFTFVFAFQRPNATRIRFNGNPKNAFDIYFETRNEVQFSPMSF